MKTEQTTIEYAQCDRWTSYDGVVEKCDSLEKISIFHFF